MDLLTPDQKKIVICLLFLLQILSSLGTDIHLPAAPSIVQEFSTTTFNVQLLLIISVALSTMTPLFWGPLSDRWGRRSVFIPATILMIVGQFLCAVAPTIHILLAARSVQYLGAGAFFSIGMAVICDLYTGAARAKTLALFEMTLPVAYMIAPLLGGILNDTYGWRFSFFALGICYTLFFVLLLRFLPETLSPKNQVDTTYPYLVMKGILKNPHFTGYILVLSFVNAAYMIFVTHAAFFYINDFGLSSLAYAGIQSLFIFVYLLGLLIYQRLIEFYPSESILDRSMKIKGVFLLLAIAITFGAIPFNAFTTTIVLLISCAVAGPIITSCNALALDRYNQNLGSCSALIEFMVGGIATFLMLLSGATFLSAVSWVYGLISLSIASALLTWLLLEHRATVISSFSQETR